MYVITCPDCGCKEIQQPDYNTFCCDRCGYEFDLEEAETECI